MARKLNKDHDHVRLAAACVRSGCVKFSAVFRYVCAGNFRMARRRMDEAARDVSDAEALLGPACRDRTT